MLNMLCPYCGSRINALAQPWQRQRAAKEKLCPACGGNVEAVFSAKLYTAWLIAMLVTVTPGLMLMGISAMNAVPPAFGLALLPSMYLRKQS
jgi:hypothetical protein